jgi:NOL1/NOP2/fmu family ribosome biogenesis protein
MRAQFLTKRELRAINDRIERTYGVRLDENTYHYFLRGRDLYRIARDLERVDIDQVKEIFAGLYVCEVLDETVRFSIEGSQIIGSSAKDRVVILEKDEWYRWLERCDIEDERFLELESGFYLVRNDAGDFFGSGLVRDGALRSWIPKGRAVNEAH